MIRLREIFRRILQLGDTPESIAGGAALGFLIAMTPPIWFQSVVALGLAWLLRVNRLAAVSMTFVTNPLTAFIYVINYVIGVWCLGWLWDWRARPWIEVWREVRSYDTLGETLRGLAGIGLGVLVPMGAGGLLVGIAGAFPIYWWVRRWVSGHRRRADVPEGP